jgi:hypothetical protein
MKPNHMTNETCNATKVKQEHFDMHRAKGKVIVWKILVIETVCQYDPLTQPIQ